MGVAGSGQGKSTSDMMRSPVVTPFWRDPLACGQNRKIVYI
jgi:hypothetical protein